MTRVNCGIPPAELSDKHLLAEHREIKRIPNCIAKGRYNLEGQLKEFTLGKGHVKFFYTRLLYLHKRYKEIYKECEKRGFKVEYYGVAFVQDGISPELYKDYTPTQKDIEIVKQRIKERTLS